MKQLKANIALSLDGFIAYKDGDISWIPNVISSTILNDINQADILLMGTNTHNEIIERNGYWIFKDKTSYVASHYGGNIAADASVHFLTASPMKTIMQLKEQAVNDLLVIGGGNFISSLIDNELLDILSVYIVPVVLGGGIPFLQTSDKSRWRLLKTETIDDIVHVLYESEKHS